MQYLRESISDHDVPRAADPIYMERFIELARSPLPTADVTWLGANPSVTLDGAGQAVAARTSHP